MNLMLLSAIPAIDPKTKENDSGLSDADLAAIHGGCYYAKGEAVSLYDCDRCARRAACPVVAMARAAYATAKNAKKTRRAATAKEGEEKDDIAEDILQ